MLLDIVKVNSLESMHGNALYDISVQLCILNILT